MRRGLGDRALEHVAVDETDVAELLDRGDEFRGRYDAAVIVDHAQQAFVVIDRAGIGVDHRLIGEAQALVAQRALHPLAQGQALAVAQALLVRDAIGHEAVAPGVLGLGERRLGPRHHFVRGLGLLGISGRADRDGGVNRARLGVDRHLARGAEDFFGDGRDVVFGAMRQNDAEPVAADAADHVGNPEAAVEPLPHLDDHLVAGLVAEDVVDAGELVDADREIGPGETGARAVREHVVERFTQALLVEMAGQVVVIRQPLETLLLRLALRHGAQHAEHAARAPDHVELDRAALVQPNEAAVAEADAVLDVERGAAIVMALQALLAQQQILGIDAAGETLAGGDGLFVGEAEHARRAMPNHGVAREVPLIGGIAGGGERGQDAGRCGVDVRDHGRRPPSRNERAAKRHRAAKS